MCAEEHERFCPLPPAPAQDYVQGAHGQMTGDEGAVQGECCRVSYWLVCGSGLCVCVCMAESVLCAQMSCICVRDGVRFVCVAELYLCAWLSWICVRG